MLLFALLLSFVAIAVGLAWFLLAFDHGQKEPIGMLWGAVGFGFFAAIAAILLETWLLPGQDIAPSQGLGALLLTSSGVGIIEEACKFLPLAIILWPKWYFNEHTDGVIYFALVGIGFGLPENLLYTLQFGAKIGLSRIIFTPIFHAAITGLVGFYLAKQKLSKRSSIGVIWALIAAMMLHALYDFGMLSQRLVWVGLAIVISLLATGGLFLLYQQATELDQDNGLSVVGNNKFCRSCGAPNPKHHLYCTRCGQNA